MATDVFTTWAAVRDQMLDDLASQSFGIRQMMKGGHQITYSSVKELREMLSWIEEQVRIEAGTTHQVPGRTYAGM